MSSRSGGYGQELLKYPSEESEKRHVVIVARIAGGDANSGNDDKNQLNAIELSTAIAVSEVAEQQLTNDGAKECEEVDDQAGPSVKGKINERDGSGDDIACKEIV